MTQAYATMAANTLASMYNTDIGHTLDTHWTHIGHTLDITLDIGKREKFAIA